MVGVVAFNEARNILHTLRSIWAQSVGSRIGRIIVIASACTDGTEALVRAASRDDPRILVVEEAVRAGKVAAINTLLRLVDEPIVVVTGGDLILEPDTLEKLVLPLVDPGVGMVGARPIPVNERDTFVGFAVNLMWELHHRIALRVPKMGELVAFRNIVASLDAASLSDELAIESKIRSRGLEIVYAAGARVYNRGPQTLRDFCKQRIRWCAANMQAGRVHRAYVSTLDTVRVLRTCIAYARETRPRLDWFLGAAMLEAWCRIRAYLEMRIPRDGCRHRIWEPLASTKNVRPEASQPID